ncbi:hypothetical protein ACAW74_25695 [Fibrella sp. WM1]|uniref:hypothetical protein n=1 Tax=Fibrella musci TaxID=3242485 RepID=UPI0035226EEB
MPKQQPNDLTVEQLKEKYGEVHQISVERKPVKYDPYKAPTADDEEIEDAVVAYIRKPNDRELGHAMSKLPAIIEAGKVIVKNCFVGGDEAILNEPALLTAAALQCVELLETRNARIKKL